MNLITTDAAHSSVMGGSTAERRILCPGSLKAEDGKPGENNDYANEGSALHVAMEWVLQINTEFLTPSEDEARTVIGKKFNDITITDELYNEKIAPALDAFNEIIDTYKIVDYMLEVRGEIPDIPGAFGTIDILGITADGVLVIIDWKFGDGRYVEVKGSYQLLFYAACALYTENNLICDMLDTYKFNGRILMGIIQPRRGREDEPNYRVTLTNETAVFDFVDLAHDAVELAHSDNAPLRTGDHCWKCRGELTCEAKTKQIAAVNIKIAPKIMSAVDIAKNLKIAKEVETWIKTLRDYAHKEAENGVKIPGFKLVNTRGNRVYADVEAAEKTLKAELGDDDAYKKELISPAQAEKKLGKKKYNTLVKKYVSIVSSGTTLALETDKRQEVTHEIQQQETLKKIQPPEGKSIFDRDTDK